MPYEPQLTETPEENYKCILRCILEEYLKLIDNHVWGEKYAVAHAIKWYIFQITF